MMKTKALVSGRVEPYQEKLIDFAFRAYAEPKIEELCLYLQNKYHANVNILLWTCWLRTESIVLQTAWLDDVLITVDTLSQLTVGRLQETRRVIKESSGFTRVQAEQINRHILTAELAAEKIFLQRLQDLTLSFLESQQNLPSSIYEVLGPEYYLNFLRIPNASERASMLLSVSRKASILPLKPSKV